MRLGNRQIPVYLMLLLMLGCGQDETIVHNGDTDPPEYTVDIDPGPFSMTLTIHESEPTAHRRLIVKGDNRLWEMGFKPGASIVIKGLNPDVQYDIEISGEDMSGNKGRLTLKGRPGAAAPLIEASAVGLYALTVLGYDFPRTYVREYHKSLTANGYNEPIPKCVRNKYGDFFLVEPTINELQEAAGELSKYTDSNDVLKYSIAAHATCGNIYLLGVVKARQIVNIFYSDDYGRQDIDLSTCYSKCQIDLIDTPNTIAMGPCWNDEIGTTRFLESKMGRIHGYWEGRIFDAYGIMKYAGEWREGNPDMTVRGFFVDMYGEASGNMLERTHPCLRITSSDGNVAAYSTREGEIAGHHPFLDHLALPVKGDKDAAH